MGRLSKHFDRLNNTMAAFEAEVEADVDKVVQRIETTVRTKKDALVMRAHESVDGHMSDLAEFEQYMDGELRGNGGPADGSDDGAKSETTGAEPGKLAANAWTSPNSQTG